MCTIVAVELMYYKGQSEYFRRHSECAPFVGSVRFPPSITQNWIQAWYIDKSSGATLCPGTKGSAPSGWVCNTHKTNTNIDFISIHTRIKNLTFLPLHSLRTQTPSWASAAVRIPAPGRMVASHTAIFCQNVQRKKCKTEGKGIWEGHLCCC